MDTNANLVKQEVDGKITVKFRENKSFEEFCEKIIPNYNRDRYEAIALRVYYGAEVIVTVYALDKSRQEGSNFDKEKLPVKKFKLQGINMPEVFAFIEEFNFTLNTGNYDLEGMEVINK